MAGRTILHVVPAALGRGAQVYAATLLDELPRLGDAHELVYVFDTVGEAERGWLRRMGLDPLALRRLRRRLRQAAPDLVVAHGGEALKYVALAAPEPPIVYLRIGTTAADAQRGPRRRLYRWLARRAEMTAAVSEDAAREARDVLGLATERVVVIENGRDPSPFVGREHLDGAGPPRLVFLGHLDPGKRPQRFIELVRALRATGDDVRAVIAGDGPSRAEVETAAAPDGIEVLGHVDDVPALLAASDVFVFVSRPEGEGMPGVLIEAGMAGLPTVTTDVPGASTVVAHGVTGFVVPVDDFDALVDATRRLARDVDLRRTMGAAAADRCHARFSLDASARRWQNVIDGLLPSG